MALQDSFDISVAIVGCGALYYAAKGVSNSV